MMSLGNVSPFEYMAMFAIHSLDVKVSTFSKQSTKTPVGGFCCSHACFIATYRFKDASWRKTSIGQPRREFCGGITLKHIIFRLLSSVSQRKKKTLSLTLSIESWLFNDGILIMVYYNPCIAVGFVSFVWKWWFWRRCSLDRISFIPQYLVLALQGVHLKWQGFISANTHSDGDWAVNWKVKRWRIWDMNHHLQDGPTTG